MTQLPTPRAAARGEAAAFLARAMAHRGDDCLFWPFSLKPNGYASVGSRENKRYAHRVVCEAGNGPPPSADHEAAHRCGNRSCVNPLHLRWATHLENHADRITHGTSNRGIQNGNAVLTPRQVLLARRAIRGGVAVKKIAEKIGVAPRTIRSAALGSTWGWLA